MTIKELEREYNKKIKALKRSLRYYEQQGRDTSALRDLINEYTQDANVRTKTGRIRTQVIRDLESVKAQSLIDKKEKQAIREQEIRARGEKRRREQELKREMKRERQEQVDKQKAKIRMAIEMRITSTLEKIRDADPHTEEGQPLYNKIKEIYTSYTDVKTKDVVIDKIIRRLQQTFGEEGLKKGYRIWGQYGLKKVEEAYMKLERFGEEERLTLDEEREKRDAERTIDKLPLPIVRVVYEEIYCYNRKDVLAWEWHAGQNYFVWCKAEALTSGYTKDKNGEKKERKYKKVVMEYVQTNYLENVEAIKYLSIKGKGEKEGYDATRDYNDVINLLKKFYI